MIAMLTIATLRANMVISIIIVRTEEQTILIIMVIIMIM